MSSTDYLNYYKGKKVLVTGGAGAIGSNLVEKLCKLGAFVIVLDNLSSGYTWNLPQDAENLLFVKGDVTNEIDLKRVFNEDPEIIFHLAAFFANQNSVDYPEKSLWTDGFGTLKLLEYTRISGKIKRFVFASSGCAIYGGEMPFPLKEDFITLHLSTPYQIGKMLGELYCNFFYHHYEIPVVKPRFFNSYGPGEAPGQYRNVIPNFIYWAMLGKTLPITGTGEETRDFAYVGDLVDGLLRSGYFENAIGKEYNLASGTETKVNDLAEWVNETTCNKGGVTYLKRRKWDTKPRLLASIEKAKEIIDYTPKMNFQQGLQNAVEWFKKNWESIKTAAKFGPGISSAVRREQ